jgi:hypothetical protein
MMYQVFLSPFVIDKNIHPENCFLVLGQLGADGVQRAGVGRLHAVGVRLVLKNTEMGDFQEY